MKPMHRILIFLLFLTCSAQDQSGPKSAQQSGNNPSPLYSITFGKPMPVGGLSPSRTIGAPFECTSDGTAFLTMLFQPSLYAPPIEQLVSISKSGEAQEFRLDQITELHDVMQKGYFASESAVVFLVRAATEDKQGKEKFVTSDGAEHEVTRNIAEHHDYLLIFDRKGNYRKRAQLDETFAVQRVAMFPSGSFLAFGFDKENHSLKLTMLNEDGTLLRIVEIPKDDAPTSMFGTQDGSGRGPAVFVKPVQLVPHGDSIVIVLNESKYPLLAVNEAGEVRAITPRLAEGKQINTLLPSDGNLYALEVGDGLIYELNAQDGSVLRRFKIGDGAPGVDVTCVHDGEFHSFAQRNGKLVQLIGTAKPTRDTTSGPEPKSQ
jgi:hypothetical protein